MRCLVLSLLIILSNLGSAQLNESVDTLNYFYRSNGDLDSIDIKTGTTASIFDGGNNLLSSTGFSTQNLSTAYSSFIFQDFTNFEKMRFSALPHVGFSYSFGGQGTQFVKFDYSQVFARKYILNLNYDKSLSNGQLRNGGFDRNVLKMQLKKEGEIYSCKVKGSYQSNTISHPGSILTDTLINDFGLAFTPVQKNNAKSEVRLAFLQWENYFDFNKDSLISIGVTTAHTYQISNRVYTEEDTLAGIYSQIFIDDFTTRDQYNLASIRNGIGFYFSKLTSRFYADAMIHQKYWDLQNLGIHHDTTELNISSNFNFVFSKIKVVNKLDVNIIGAYNEWKNTAYAEWVKRNLNARLIFNAKQISANPIQRHYFANNVDYKLGKVENQSTIQLGGATTYFFKDSTSHAGLSADIYKLSDYYLFDGVSWRNDTMNSLYFGALTFKISTHFKNFYMQPKVIYSIDNKGYLPEFMVFTRLFYKARIFEAKKLELYGGCELSYFSGFNKRTYIPFMDAFDWFSPQDVTASISNAHLFTGFSIDEFRFFIRYENIGYFWNDKTINVMQGYPIPSTRLRLGIAWDFIN